MTDTAPASGDPAADRQVDAVARRVRLQRPGPRARGVAGGGQPLADVQVRVPLGMLNRHGLVAGATGTGKTKTLQLMAEQLSAHGVPVFLADIKGDLSGISQPGQPSDKLTQRAQSIGQTWQATGYPAEYLALGGLGTGVPVRATVTSFGPMLLAKVLDLNETQTSSLVARLPLRRPGGARPARPEGPAGRHPVPRLGRGQGRPRRARRPQPGHRRCAAARARRVRGQGAEQFFGEPEFDSSDLLRTAPDGRGLITCSS